MVIIHGNVNIDFESMKIDKDKDVSVNKGHGLKAKERKSLNKKK